MQQSATDGACYVYVDGFNLCYMIRRTPNRWLDVVALADLLAGEPVAQVRYFTGRVKALDDPTTPQRQQVYLRALGVLPRLSIHYGQFNSNQHTLPLEENENRMLLRNGRRAGTRVHVLKREEKGSDVNLATNLLIDAYERQFTRAIVISNDTDLVEPIRHVNRVLGMPVRIATARARPAKRLAQASAGHILINADHLGAAQLPWELQDRDGRSVHKPPRW
jgi:hypothetical protein